MKKRILFVCVQNSARSQMAEAWLNELCGDEFDVHSAGLEPGTLNPVVVECMAEVALDISGAQTKSVFEMWKSGWIFAYVITVCDEASAARCPVFPGLTKQLHWSFPDPSQITGSDEFKLAETRRIRDLIKARVSSWCSEVCELSRPIA